MTHGAKPKGRIERHGPVRQQALNLRAFAKGSNLSIGVMTFDHVRSARNLESFSLLNLYLERLKKAKKGIVFIDDLNRLVRACPLEERGQLLIDLAPFGDHLFCVRQGRRFSKITANELDAIQLNPDRGRWSFAERKSRLSEEDKRDQTRKAVAASRKVRSAAADARARELATIRDEMIASGDAPAPAAVAEEANRRGLRNSWGNPWRPPGVANALRRLEDRPDEGDAGDSSPERVRSS